MSCKPESPKKRLERIAVPIMAAQAYTNLPFDQAAAIAVEAAKALIKQLDALPLDE